MKQQGKEGLETSFVVRRGDGHTAVTGRSQLLLSFLGSASVCLPNCWICTLAAATGSAPDAWLQTQGPLQAPPPANPPWAAEHVFSPQISLRALSCLCASASGELLKDTPTFHLPLSPLRCLSSFHCWVTYLLSQGAICFVAFADFCGVTTPAFQATSIKSLKSELGRQVRKGS